MLKCKVLIKLNVLSCVLICCVYGDTIRVEVVVLCLLVALCWNRAVDISLEIVLENVRPEDGEGYC